MLFQAVSKGGWRDRFTVRYKAKFKDSNDRFANVKIFLSLRDTFLGRDNFNRMQILNSTMYSVPNIRKHYNLGWEHRNVGEYQSDILASDNQIARPNDPGFVKSSNGNTFIYRYSVGDNTVLKSQSLLRELIANERNEGLNYVIPDVPPFQIPKRSVIKGTEKRKSRVQ